MLQPVIIKIVLWSVKKRIQLCYMSQENEMICVMLEVQFLLNFNTLHLCLLSLKPYLILGRWPEGGWYAHAWILGLLTFFAS